MEPFSDKYALTKQQSLFLAKKKWDENIYCGMKMENRNITFPQTQTILNGVNVPGVTLGIYRAKEMLAEVDLKINDISAKLGYQSVNSFIRMFKRYAGVTPGGYRKRLLST